MFYQSCKVCPCYIRLYTLQILVANIRYVLMLLGMQIDEFLLTTGIAGISVGMKPRDCHIKQIQYTRLKLKFTSKDFEPYMHVKIPTKWSNVFTPKYMFYTWFHGFFVAVSCRSFPNFVFQLFSAFSWISDYLPHIQHIVYWVILSEDVFVHNSNNSQGKSK